MAIIIIIDITIVITIINLQSVPAIPSCEIPHCSKPWLDPLWGPLLLEVEDITNIRGIEDGIESCRLILAVGPYPLVI